MRKLGIRLVLCLAFCSLLTTTAFASLATKLFHNNNWFVGASLGTARPSIDKSTTVPNGSSQPSPYNVDLYNIDQPGSSNAWSVLFGYRWLRDSLFFPMYSIALRYQSLHNFTVNGTIEQYSLPNFTNYNYGADVSAQTWTLQAKLDLYKCRLFAPFLSFGVGKALDKFSGYDESAVSGITPRVSPAFASETNTHTTVNAGFGVDYFLNKQFTFSLAYEYDDFGTIRSAEATGNDWYGEKLSFGKLTTDTISLGAVYQLPLG